MNHILYECNTSTTRFHVLAFEQVISVIQKMTMMKPPLGEHTGSVSMTL